MRGSFVAFVAIFLIYSLEMMGGAEGKPQPQPEPQPEPGYGPKDPCYPEPSYMCVYFPVPFKGCRKDKRTVCGGTYDNGTCCRDL